MITIFNQTQLLMTPSAEEVRGHELKLKDSGIEVYIRTKRSSDVLDRISSVRTSGQFSYGVSYNDAGGNRFSSVYYLYVKRKDKAKAKDILEI